MTRTPGISLILPSYNNSETLARSLESVAAQTLSDSLIELIVVLNGAADRSRTIVESFRAAHPEIEAVCVVSKRNGAGRARNLGLTLASRTYVTFLDDDDALESQYLERAWSACGPAAIAVVGIQDVDSDGTALASNSLDARIMGLRGKTVPLHAAPWLLGFNASKVFPIEVATRLRFAEDLRSGEDVVFFAQFLDFPALTFRIPSDLDGARYLRTMTPNSVSRQKIDFDFAVRQRLECISRIRAAAHSYDQSPTTVARNALVDAQFSFVRDYLTRFPEHTGDAIKLATELGVSGLPWAGLRAKAASRVVFSFCFPPFADTAGNVASKRIREQGELVDVFSANMSKVRSIDSSSLLMVEQFIGHREVLDVTPSFSNWFLICSFATHAARRASKLSRKQGGYQSMYSRSMWSGSHVAGVLFKLRHPSVTWEAEFSDPMRLDAQGQQRKGKISPHPVTLRLRRLVSHAGIDTQSLDSHFALTEAATFIAADTLVFTNEVQRELMLAPYPQHLRERFLSKSTVLAQSQPDSGLYELVQSEYELEEHCVHVGYFGSFYENRGVGDVVKAIAALPEDLRQVVRLHIFCPNPEKAQAQLWALGAPEQVIVNAALPYLEFLNLAQKFDALLVNDTDVSGTDFAVNPFLPSKFADYSGAGVPIWGILTKDSPLSKQQMRYRSGADGFSSVVSALRSIIETGMDH